MSVVEDRLTKLDEGIDSLREMISNELGGAGGVRERLTRVEEAFKSHENSDEARHGEVRIGLTETRTAIAESIKPLHAQLRMQLVVIALAFVALVVLAGRSFMFEGFGVKAGGGGAEAAAASVKEAEDAAEVIEDQ